MADTGLVNLLPQGSKVRLSGASSSATRKGLLNPQNEEPWTAPSLPASIHIIFAEPINNATHIALTFQGGFVGTEAMLYVAPKGKEEESQVEMGLMMGGKIYPEDKNKRQVFRISYPPGMDIQTAPMSNGVPDSQDNPKEPHIQSVPTSSGATSQTNVSQPTANGIDDSSTHPDITELKIEFEKSSDQYGRITVYSVEVLG